MPSRGCINIHASLLPRLPGAGYYAMRVPGWLETVLSTGAAYNFPLVARGRLVGAMIVGLQRDRLGRTAISLSLIHIWYNSPASLGR